MKQFYSSIFCLSLLFNSCSSSEYMNPDDLLKYTRKEGHGLYKAIEANGTKMEVTYRPTDLLVNQELNNSKDTASINRLREKYSDYYYFILSLSKDNKEALHQPGNLRVYSDLVQTMSFRMSEYVSLTTLTSDTIPVEDFILNRTFGMSASTDILFAFNKNKLINKEWIQFNLKEFGLGTGLQIFRFRTRDIEKAPKVYKIHKG